MARIIAKDHGDKRDRILTIVTKIFAETGFDRASMNIIAVACGVSKAALYHYFPSKNSILFSILDRHLSDLCKHVVSLKRKEMSAEDFLAYTIEEILVFYRGNDDVHELQMHALGQLEQSDQDQLRKYMRTIVEEVSRSIKVIRPDFFSNESLRMTTMSLFGMLNWYYTWNRGRGIEQRRKYARHVASILLHGLYGLEKQA